MGEEGEGTPETAAGLVLVYVLIDRSIYDGTYFLCAKFYFVQYL